MKTRIFGVLIIVLCMCLFMHSFAAPLAGDLNNDESVDLDDAVLLLQYSMFPEDYPLDYEGSVDFVEDGSIDLDDAVYLLQYSMFPEDYPIEPLPVEPEIHGHMEQAVYLIDDISFAKERYDGHGFELTHGWNVDNRGNAAVNKYAEFNGALSDCYTDSSVSMYRYITPVSEGKLTLEAEIFLGNADDGFELGFYEDENCVVKLFTRDGFYGLSGVDETLSDEPVEEKSAKIKMEMDLDKAVADLYIGPWFVCSTDIDDFDFINKISVGTTDEGKLFFSPERIALYINYAVNDSFMLYEEGETPLEYETDGDVETAENYCGSDDDISVRMFDESSAEREFSRLGDGFAIELYVIQEDIYELSEILVGDMLLEMCEGIYYADGEKIGTYSENVWQCVRFERQPGSGKIVVRICGKDVYEYKSNEKISSLIINNYGGTLWFDDVKCFNIYEFEDYVPEPETIEKKTDITVCMSVCSLWHEGTHYGWDYVSPYDELIPVLGFYDEGLPETADWEIKYMVESGIDALQPCWYASSTTAPMKSPRLNKYAIHDGYFNAKYKDRLDICIMWENQGVKSGLTLDNFKNYLWNYWVDWYFKDPNYMCFDNKPVLTIYQYDAFVSAFGSAEKAKKAIEFMREDIKNYGYDGLILLFNIYSADQANSIDKKASDSGMEIDGLLPYHWGVDAYDPENIRVQHENGYTGKGDNAIIATASTGRNIIGWEQTRTPIATYDQHLEALEYLTEELLVTYAEDFGEDSWQSKLLFLGTWNEFAEGHWLMPTGINGKGPGQDYMNVWKEVFVKDPEELVVPTQNQKDRISYLYPGVITPIRAELIETQKETPEDQTKLVAEFDFEKNSYDSSEFSSTRYDEVTFSDGKFCGVAESENTKADPLFVVRKAFTGVDAKDVDVIHIRMKANTATGVSLYPMFEGDTGYSANKMLSTRYDKRDAWLDVYIETKDYIFWTGKILNLRFDLINTYGTVECDFIRLLKRDEGGFEINVDGETLDINSQYITEKDGELYIAALPAEGFYSALGITYEWHRFDKKLRLVMGVGENTMAFGFEVGSDICLVNGREKTLEREFYLFDEIPVIPVTFLLEEAGVEYEYAEGESLYVNVRDEEYDTEKSPYDFNFDIPDDYCGFGVKRAKGFVYNGELLLFPQRQSNGAFDPILNNNSFVPFAAANCNSITVRMKYDLDGAADGYATMYFNTESDSSFSEARSVKRKLSSQIEDEDGYCLYEFDMSECEKFKGKISAIRFDVANCDGEFAIDYIKINMED